MRCSILLPRAVRWMLLAIVLMLFTVVMPAVMASKPQEHAAHQLGHPITESPAPAPGHLSPATDFQPETRANIELPSQAYRMAVKVDEITYGLQPLTASQQQNLA